MKLFQGLCNFCLPTKIHLVIYEFVYIRVRYFLLGSIHDGDTNSLVFRFLIWLSNSFVPHMMVVSDPPNWRRERIFPLECCIWTEIGKWHFRLGLHSKSGLIFKRGNPMHAHRRRREQKTSGFGIKWLEIWIAINEDVIDLWEFYSNERSVM